MKPLEGLGVLLGGDVQHTSVLGTCFLFGDPRTVLTAAHCVADLGAEQLRVRLPMRGSEAALEVYDVRVHPEADLAMLRVEAGEDALRDAYRGPGRPHFQGQSLVAFGYTEESDDNGVVYSLRCFVGNLQRWFDFPFCDDALTRVIETSFPSPTGLSGGPLFTGRNHLEVVGLMAGNLESASTVFKLKEIEQDGQIFREEVARIIEYGVAVDLAAQEEWLAVPWG